MRLRRILRDLRQWWEQEGTQQEPDRADVIARMAPLIAARQREIALARKAVVLEVDRPGATKPVSVPAVVRTIS